MPSPMPSRRTLLGLAALGGALTLTGCTLRFENADDVPAEVAAMRADAAVLGPLAQQVTYLGERARSISGHPLAARLAVHHQEQFGVLRAWLAGAGAEAAATATAAPATGGAPRATGTSPGKSAAASDRSGASATARPTPTGPATPDSLALDERDGIHERGLEPLSRIAERERITALSVQAHRVAAATLLTGGDTSGAHAPLPPETSADLLTTLRAAQHVIGTVRGRTTDKTASAELARVAAVVSAWETPLTLWAGEKAPGAHLGYPLTPRPSTASIANAAVAKSLADAIGAAGTHLPGVLTPDHMLTLVTYIGELSATGDRFGLPLVAFPGLKR